VVLKEYVQLLHNFSKNLDPNLQEESYSRKALLLRVYGQCNSSSSHSQSADAPIKRFSMSSQEIESHQSKSKSPSRYDLEVSLDQIQILGLNPQTLLNRDSPTLYLSMTIQQSHVTDSASSSPLASQSLSSAIPVLTIPLNYSHSTSTWLMTLTQDDDHPHSSPPPSHLFSFSSHTYSHCILSCELWYKSFLTRSKKHLGTIQYHLGGLDTNETKMTQPIDVSQAFKEFKEKVSSQDQALHLKMVMKLKPVHR
jgi:hypothetical protein